MALAAYLSAIFKRLLPLGVLLDNTLPPDILLLGNSLIQEVNCLAVGNYLIPLGPISLIRVRTVPWLKPSIA